MSAALISVASLACALAQGMAPAYAPIANAAAIQLSRNIAIVCLAPDSWPSFVVVGIEADIQPGDAAAYSAHSVGKARRDEFHVARLDRVRFAADDLTLFQFSAGGQCARSFSHHPHVCGDGMHQPGFRVGNTPDVYVEAATFQHAERLLLLRVHVAVVALQRFEWNAYRLIGGR